MNGYTQMLGAVLLIIFGASGSGFAQESVTPPADSLTAAPDSTVVEEMLLETIHIDAEVKKPSVTLIPKKIEPKVIQLPFNRRSFEDELRAKPRLLSKYHQQYTIIKQIKKNLAKED